jgi:hypothetical protein
MQSVDVILIFYSELGVKVKDKIIHHQSTTALHI